MNKPPLSRPSQPDESPGCANAAVALLDRVLDLPEAECGPYAARPEADAGLGAMRTERGNLPLDLIDVRTRVTGLTSAVELVQDFVNVHPEPLEATYIFPLPDRFAVTGARMTAAGRTVAAVLQERFAARAAYDQAIATGRRASIVEEERPDVFTMRVGNILPGERIRVALSLAGPLSYEDGEATMRIPLVVAPRYIPGAPLPGEPVGDGHAPDTDAVPDASRITPPVLLPGFPHPVRLAIEVTVDPGGLPLVEARSSLSATIRPLDEAGGPAEPGRAVVIRVDPGHRADRDFVLRLRYGHPVHPAHSLILVPDAAPIPENTAAPQDGVDGGMWPGADPAGGVAWPGVRAADGGWAGPDGPGHDRVPGTSAVTGGPIAGRAEGRAATAGPATGTFQLTLLPPADVPPPRPRDVVLLLDRSGSMAGWKMVAARRAAARIIDTLTGADRFAVLTFDTVVERPAGLPPGLAEATDRHRFRAVEHLAKAEARGGTELLTPMREAFALLTAETAGTTTAAEPGGARDRVVVLVTDGQVGNEDQILQESAPACDPPDATAGVRVHAVGIDQAVNAGFLGRLAALGAGRCELVESEDRLDEAMEHIHRRIGSPLVTGVTLTAEGFTVRPDTMAPSRPVDLFPGSPVIIGGRFTGWSGGPEGSGAAGSGDRAALVVRGLLADGSPWQVRVPATRGIDGSGVAATWARAHLRDMEDSYTTSMYLRRPGAPNTMDWERRIVETSLNFGVLCRFTAFVAVDSEVVAEGRDPHRVVQPVEPVAGWDMLGSVPLSTAAFAGPPPGSGRAARPSGPALSGRPSGPARVSRQPDTGPPAMEWTAQEQELSLPAPGLAAPSGPPPAPSGPPPGYASPSGPPPAPSGPPPEYWEAPPNPGDRPDPPAHTGEPVPPAAYGVAPGYPPMATSGGPPPTTSAPGPEQRSRNAFWRPRAGGRPGRPEGPGRPGRPAGQGQPSNPWQPDRSWRPGRSEGDPGLPADLRHQAELEARRLRAAQNAPRQQRRDALSDLGTRLAALAPELIKRSVDTHYVAAVRELARQITLESAGWPSGEPGLTTLWRRALVVLDALAAGEIPPAV